MAATATDVSQCGCEEFSGVYEYSSSGAVHLPGIPRPAEFRYRTMPTQVATTYGGEAGNKPPGLTVLTALREHLYKYVLYNYNNSQEIHSITPRRYLLRLTEFHPKSYYMMVNITSIRSANADFASLPLAKGLVAVFVGATAGIGESALRTFVSNTVNPTVYFVGRSESAGTKITADLQALNPSSKIQFLQADTTLLSTVDKVTNQIAASEKKLNLLFMSPGYMTMQSRDESPEGIDRKMAISYYARMRFALNLLPLLSTSEPARVISVLGPGTEGALDMKDLGLVAPGSFSLATVARHTVTMTSLTFEHLSRQYPNIGWIHATPGFVITGLTRGLPAPLRILSKITEPLLKFASTPIGDSGQGFFYLGTQEKFAKGLWLVDWKGESVDSRVEEGKNRCAKSGAEWWGDSKVEAVWRHTEEVMASVKK